MSASISGLIRLILSEQFGKPISSRIPEPCLEMTEEESVSAFHEQGSEHGPLIPVYHFCATHISRRCPKGGTLLDVGSGSGQFLKYLARQRPDMRIYGVDLSPEMVELGNASLKADGVSDQVTLLHGDMCKLQDIESVRKTRFSMVSSVFALHHLPAFDAMVTCLKDLRTILDQAGENQFFFFDHARPRASGTPKIFPDVFTPDSAKEFKLDSENSLRASFSPAEFFEAMQTSGFADTGQHVVSRIIPFYQVLASENNDSDRHINALPPIEEKSLKKDFEGLNWLFKALH